MTSRMLLRPLAAALLVAVLLGGCSSGGGTDVEATGTLPERTSTTEAPFVPERSPLADQVTPAGSAATAPAATDVSVPVGFRFDAIGAESAIAQVGVAADGQMEIPGASEVGWYRFGPSPGAAGSAVLAAHVAWNGEDGVFRRLTAAAPGDRFTVTYDDGSAREFEVAAVRQYPKDRLPVDELFAVDGPDQVVLVTCGGSFNRQISSYDDNIVAYAVAV
jgi:LPXTG-site transpeptidase (sortase) family protein